MTKKYKISDLAFALDNAAEFLEMEETFSFDDANSQWHANQEAAKRIRKMAQKQWDKSLKEAA